MGSYFSNALVESLVIISSLLDPVLSVSVVRIPEALSNNLYILFGT